MTSGTKDYGIKPTRQISKEGIVLSSTRFLENSSRLSSRLPKILSRNPVVMARPLAPSLQAASAWKNPFSVSIVKSLGLGKDETVEVYIVTLSGESLSVKPNKVLSPNGEALYITIKRLNNLMDLEEEDDYGTLRPTNFALKKALFWVKKVAKKLGENFPRASVSTDEEGGIRLTWSSRSNNREVRLICPEKPDKKPYIYHRFGEEYGIEKKVTALILSSCLNRLNNDERIERG